MSIKKFKDYQIKIILATRIDDRRQISTKGKDEWNKTDDYYNFIYNKSENIVKVGNISITVDKLKNTLPNREIVLLRPLFTIFSSLAVLLLIIIIINYRVNNDLHIVR